MCCILCLDSGPTASVNINSAEGQKLCIWCIIEKYFSWLKLTLHNADICVCHQCWDALFTFHQFYVQVERTHKILERDLKPTENCVLAEQLSSLAEAAPMNEDDAATGQIEIEPETKKSEVVKAKCKQSPPRKKKLVKKCKRLKASLKRAATANKQKPKDVESYDPIVKNKNLDLVETLNAVEALHTGKLSEIKEEPAEMFDDDMEFISEPNDPEERPVKLMVGDYNLDRNLVDKNNPAALKNSSQPDVRSANRLRSGMRCCMPNCYKSKRTDDDLKMFRFPSADVILGQIWRKICNISPDDCSKNLYICHHHFHDSDIGKKYLRRSAVPMRSKSVDKIRLI